MKWNVCLLYSWLSCCDLWYPPFLHIHLLPTLPTEHPGTILEMDGKIHEWRHGHWWRRWWRQRQKDCFYLFICVCLCVCVGCWVLCEELWTLAKPGLSHIVMNTMTTCSLLFSYWNWSIIVENVWRVNIEHFENLKLKLEHTCILKFWLESKVLKLKNTWTLRISKSSKIRLRILSSLMNWWWCCWWWWWWMMMMMVMMMVMDDDDDGWWWWWWMMNDERWMMNDDKFLMMALMFMVMILWCDWCDRTNDVVRARTFCTFIFWHLKPVPARKKAKKPTKKKETDIATAKLRSATKVVNQRKLLAALFKDTEEKLQAGPAGDTLTHDDTALNPKWSVGGFMRSPLSVCSEGCWCIRHLKVKGRHKLDPKSIWSF